MQASHTVMMNTCINFYAHVAILVFISLYITRLFLSTLVGGDFGIFNIVKWEVTV